MCPPGQSQPAAKWRERGSEGAVCGGTARGEGRERRSEREREAEREREREGEREGAVCGGTEREREREGKKERKASAQMGFLSFTVFSTCQTLSSPLAHSSVVIC